MREFNSGQHSDVVAAGVAVWKRRIERLGRMLRTGQVVVEVRTQLAF